jgi:aminopeptidase
MLKNIIFVYILIGLSLSPIFALADCLGELGGGAPAESVAGPWDSNSNRKLINLLIENGIDFRAGDKVVVRGARYQSAFIEAVATELMRRGAGAVQVLYQPSHADIKEAIRTNESPEHFAERFFPKALTEKMIDQKYASIKIEGSNESGVPEGIDSSQWTEYLTAVATSFRPYVNFMAADNVQWTLVELPTPLQAQLVAPELSPEAAMATLKKMVADVYWLDQSNPSELWKKSAETIEARGAKLNALGIKKLHYQGPGTDLTIELNARAFWKGGRHHANGRSWQANFPTFENFVTPLYRSTEGHVEVKRPVSVLGTLVRGAWFKFSKGQVVDYGASEGKVALDQFFAQDPRNRFLGEAALVDDDSPVYKQERLFYSIVFDENALSHIALGAGYTHTFIKPYPVNDDEFEAVGMNSPKTVGHTDFMIGSPELNIIAETHSGEHITLMKNGKIMLPR